MSYADLTNPHVGDVFTSPTIDPPTPWNQIKANFEAGIPGVFVGAGAGRLAFGTGLKALGVLAAPPANNMALVCEAANPTGWAWKSGTIPIGMIIIWSGAAGSIPTGWQICDGTGGTPDLRGQFVVGAGSTYAVGATGGAATMDLSHIHNQTDANVSSETWAHTHTQAATGAEAAHTHTAAGTTGAATGGGTNTGGTGASGATQTHTHDVTGTGAGASHTHTNPDTDSGGPAHAHVAGAINSSLSAVQSKMSPYYALCFIQRTS